MILTFKVYGYKAGSRSAKTLAEALNGKVLKHVNSKYRPRRGDVIVNWGSSNVPDFAPATTLNADTRVAGCKLATFLALSEAGVRVPEFTTDKEDVLGAIEFKDWVFPVVCRTKLRGHSGDGIVIANNAEELVDAPLYVQYKKKKDEYRVHVMRQPNIPGLGLGGASAFFIQRKARKLDVENPNWLIRNLEGGFVFVEVEEADVPADVITQAEATIEALKLDFGGVDVIWNEHEGKAYALEINTACGLEDRTADRYQAAITAAFPA